MKLDPRTKLLLYVCGTLATLLTNKPATLLGLLMVALLVVILVRGVRRWIGVLKLLTPMLVLLAVFSALGGSWLDAVSPVLKLLTLGTLAAGFFASTDVDELGDALTLMRLPEGISFIVVGGLRYTPVVTHSWSALVDSQRARGAIVSKGVRGLPGYARLLVPSVVRALRTADDMAEAMESRGFGSKHVTMLVDYRLRELDWLLAALGLGALIVYMILVL